MLDIMFNFSDYPKGLTSYPHIGRSFTDVGVGAIFGDSQVLFLGYMIVINYVYIMLLFYWNMNYLILFINLLN